MLARSNRVTLFLGTVVCLALAFSQAGAQAHGLASKPSQPVAQRMLSASDILYTQLPDPNGVLFPSSWWDPDGSSADQYIWDNFTLGSTQSITETDWMGGYDPALFGSGGPVLDFGVAFFPSSAGGTQPDIFNPLAQYRTGGNFSETPAGTLGGIVMYNYRFVLPTPFQAAAGTKYWVQIYAFQHGSPDWGLTKGLGGEGVHFRRWHSGIGDSYLITPGDVAFTLLGPSAPIGNLSATNGSPTALGYATTFTATVSAGSGISYTWNFGDQATRSGQVVTHTYAAIGSYTAVVTATNSLGSVAATTPVTITDAPIAGLAAINNSPTPFGSVTSLTATITSGSNASYQWNLGDGALRQGAAVTHTYGAIGFYTAIVTGTNSVSAVTATTPITIFSAAPLANAGPDQTVRDGDSVTLDGSGSFALPGHRPLTYLWQQIGGVTVALSSDTISRPTFVAPTGPAVLTFTLVVTDSFAIVSDPDQVRINVLLTYRIWLPLILKTG